MLLFLMLLISFTINSQRTPKFPVPGYSQGKYDIGYIGIENGLANNAVTSVYKDKRGLMWFGTYDGVSRFDGYNFSNYRNEPNDANSLINNRVVSICGTQNEIWIGTKNGISVYSYLTNQFSKRYCINPKTAKKELIDVAINAIKNYKSNIYIASAGKGLIFCSGKEQKMITIPLYVNGKLQWDYHVQGIDFDPSGNLWAFVQGVGIVIMEPSAKKLSVVYSDVLSGGCVFYDGFSNFWVAIEGGLMKYNTVDKTLRIYYNPEIQYPISDLIYKPDTKELWIATNGNGVVRYNFASDTFSLLNNSLGEEKLNSNAISSLCLDSGNRVWIGTLRGGVNRVESRKTPFTTISKNEKLSNTLPSNFILSFCEQDSNHLWIGTDGAGASLWDKKSNVFTNYSFNPDNPNSLANNFVATIVKDEKGVWFGTYGGGVCIF